MAPFKFLKIERSPNDQVLELLEENAIGTPGLSMVYKHHDVRAKIANVPNPYFANLSIRNRLYATICLSQRDVHSLGKPHQAYYLRYFTFRESFRTTNPKSLSRKTPSQIREDVIDLMNGEGLGADENMVLYAYVDSHNIRSKRLIDEFGFKQFGNFKVIPFNRLFPRKSKKIIIADSSTYALVSKILTDFYQVEQMISHHNLFKRGNYFVLMEDGKMVCGVQAIPDRWDILEMPGITGKLLMKVIPKIPIFNRLFNPQYKFVFFESLFCREGFEDRLSELFSSALHYHKVYSGIFCTDPRSKVYKLLKMVSLGITHKLQGEKEIDIMVKTSKENVISKNDPICVSGFDVL